MRLDGGGIFWSGVWAMEDVLITAKNDDTKGCLELYLKGLAFSCYKIGKPMLLIAIGG